METERLKMRLQIVAYLKAYATLSYAGLHLRLLHLEQKSATIPLNLLLQVIDVVVVVVVVVVIIIIFIIIIVSVYFLDIVQWRCYDGVGRRVVCFVSSDAYCFDSLFWGLVEDCLSF